MTPPTIRRPWPVLGIGWVLAIIVLVLAILVGVAGIAVPMWILIAMLAAALLL